MFTPFVVSLSNHEKKPFDKLRANGKNSLSQKYLQQQYFYTASKILSSKRGEEFGMSYIF
jgi:hypothetical protein